MTMVNRLTIALACSAMLAAGTGCAQTPPEQPGAQSTPRKPVIREHASTSRAAPNAPRESGPPPAKDDLLSRMGDDLAKRLGTKKSELQVLAAESVVWNDGALGCPSPGATYTQATVPGVRVLFQRAGRTYQYHGSDRGYFIYCENPPARAGNYDER